MVYTSSLRKTQSLSKNNNKDHRRCSYTYAYILVLSFDLTWLYVRWNSPPPDHHKWLNLISVTGLCKVKTLSPDHYNKSIILRYNRNDWWETKSNMVFHYQLPNLNNSKEYYNMYKYESSSRSPCNGREVTMINNLNHLLKTYQLNRCTPPCTSVAGYLQKYTSFSLSLLENAVELNIRIFLLVNFSLQ